MAMVSSCSVAPYKDWFHPTKGTTQIKRGIPNDSLPSQKVYTCLLYSITGDSGTRWHVGNHGSKLLFEAKRKQKFDACCMIHMQRSHKFLKPIEFPLLKVYNRKNHKNSHSEDAYERAEPHLECHALENRGKERQLKALDSYFSKLHDETEKRQSSCLSKNKLETVSDMEEFQMKSSSQSKDETTEMVDTGDEGKVKRGLGSLENYFGQLTDGMDKRKRLNEEASRKKPPGVPNPPIVGFERKGSMTVEQTHKTLENMENESSAMLSDNENMQDLQTYDEASDFYLINILAAINIAVFLFEIASPIRNSDLERLSLPLMYGAKINKLILVGEWWRLLTPMFLHSGFLHVSLGCWVLLTFGPRVSRGYGPFTFFLIYLLGGLCGNLTSFIHTPELTVCGTGPVFAIIGAWLVYQTQNKGVISREVSETMFWKAVMATALSFLLSNFGRIDDWTHLGAALAGVAFAFLTCPTLQLDDASSKHGQKEGLALIQRQTDPCRSLATFSAIILVLSLLVFFFEPQLAGLELDDIE